jgi:hypothetical protein
MKKRNIYCIEAIFVVVVYEIQNEHAGRGRDLRGLRFNQVWLEDTSSPKGMTKFSSLVPVK